jgi:hypothetical protein
MRQFQTAPIRHEANIAMEPFREQRKSGLILSLLIRTRTLYAYDPRHFYNHTLRGRLKRFGEQTLALMELAMTSKQLSCLMNDLTEPH